MSVCIYTAIYGDYDELKSQPPQSVDSEFVCFTDNRALCTRKDWRVITDSRLHNFDPRLRAKFFKVNNHRVFRGLLAKVRHLDKFDTTIWLDASVQITTSDFVSEILGSLRRFGFGLIPHPRRNCIYAEAQASEGFVKYQGLPLRQQVEAYRRLGYPEENGLMACGVIARKMSNQYLRRINRDWWQEITRWSYQDQLSLPFVLWKNSYWYDEIRLNLWKNHMFQILPHNSDL